jgi:hypothetical protein
MYAPIKLKKISQLKLTILAATLLILAGLSIWLYATSVIQGHTQLLASSGLSQEETWSYEGSLQWWKTTYATTIMPLTAIMITGGSAILIAPIAWTKLQQKNVLKSFTDNLELASTENFEVE